MSDRPIRVLCVDDSPDVAEVLEATVQAESDMESVGMLGSADSLDAEIASRHPDVALLDLTMPGRDPMDALQEASVSHPEVRTVAVSGYDDQSRVDAAFQRGAWGFVAKDAGVPTLLDAISTVARGGVWLKASGAP